MKRKEYYLKTGKLFSIFLVKCLVATILAVLLVDFCEQNISEKNSETFKAISTIPSFIILALAYASFMDSFKLLKKKKHNKRL